MEKLLAMVESRLLLRRSAQVMEGPNNPSPDHRSEQKYDVSLKLRGGLLDLGWKTSRVHKLVSISTMGDREIETETERKRERYWNLRQL